MTPGYRFTSTAFTPPQELFFYETHGRKAVGRTLAEIAPKVRALMERFSIDGAPEDAVAEYMCPRIPGLPCERPRGAPADGVRPPEAWRNSLPYCAMPPTAPILFSSKNCRSSSNKPQRPLFYRAVFFVVHK